MLKTNRFFSQFVKSLRCWVCFQLVSMCCESQVVYRRHYNRKCVAINLVSGVAKSLRLYGCEGEGFAKA
jgi:hypothetical protein